MINEEHLRGFIEGLSAGDTYIDPSMAHTEHIRRAFELYETEPAIRWMFDHFVWMLNANARLLHRAERTAHAALFPNEKP